MRPRNGRGVTEPPRVRLRRGISPPKSLCQGILGISYENLLDDPTKLLNAAANVSFISNVEE